MRRKNVCYNLYSVYFFLLLNSNTNSVIQYNIEIWLLVLLCIGQYVEYFSSHTKI